MFVIVVLIVAQLAQRSCHLRIITSLGGSDRVRISNTSGFQTVSLAHFSGHLPLGGVEFGQVIFEIAQRLEIARGDVQLDKAVCTSSLSAADAGGDPRIDVVRVDICIGCVRRRIGVGIRGPRWYWSQTHRRMHH